MSPGVHDLGGTTIWLNILSGVSLNADVPSNGPKIKNGGNFNLSDFSYPQVTLAEFDPLSSHEKLDRFLNTHAEVFVTWPDWFKQKGGYIYTYEVLEGNRSVLIKGAFFDKQVNPNISTQSHFYIQINDFAAPVTKFDTTGTLSEKHDNIYPSNLENNQLATLIKNSNKITGRVDSDTHANVNITKRSNKEGSVTADVTIDGFYDSSGNKGQSSKYSIKYEGFQKHEATIINNTTLKGANESTVGGVTPDSLKVLILNNRNTLFSYLWDEPNLTENDIHVEINRNAQDSTKGVLPVNIKINNNKATDENGNPALERLFPNVKLKGFQPISANEGLVVPTKVSVSKGDSSKVGSISENVYEVAPFISPFVKKAIVEGINLSKDLNLNEQNIVATRVLQSDNYRGTAKVVVNVENIPQGSVVGVPTQITGKTVDLAGFRPDGTTYLTKSVFNLPKQSEIASAVVEDPLKQGVLKNAIKQSVKEQRFALASEENLNPNNPNVPAKVKDEDILLSELTANDKEGTITGTVTLPPSIAIVNGSPGEVSFNVTFTGFDNQPRFLGLVWWGWVAIACSLLVVGVIAAVIIVSVKNKKDSTYNVTKLVVPGQKSLPLPRNPRREALPYSSSRHRVESIPRRGDSIPRSRPRKDVTTTKTIKRKGPAA